MKAVSRLTCFFFFCLFACFLNQLGRVNELIIRPDLSDLTDEKVEKDVVRESEEEEKEEESVNGADCIYTATSLDNAFNVVMLPLDCV